MDAPSPVAASDEQLLAEFVDRRSEAAFAEVVRRHGGMVLSVCRSVLGNTADAEDAAQAVFLTLAQKAKSAGVRSHLVGFLHRVAWYVAARAAEGKAIRRRHEQEAARMRRESLPTEREPIQFSGLQAAFAGMPEKYRVPLILHHMEGRSHAQTAAITGCSAETIAVRLHRGREMLRKRLDRKGISTSMAGLAGGWGPPIKPTTAFVAGAAKSATSMVAGLPASAAVISAQALALSKGAMSMLFWEKVKMLAAIAVIALLVSGGVGAAWAANSGETAAPIKPAPETHTAPVEPAPPPKPIAVTPPATPRYRTGQIVRIDAASITLHQQTGPDLIFPLDGSTDVNLDGKRVAVTDLKIGIDAAVIFFAPGQPAKEIRARTRISTTPN